MKKWTVWFSVILFTLFINGFGVLVSTAFCDMATVLSPGVQVTPVASPVASAVGAVFSVSSVLQKMPILVKFIYTHWLTFIGGITMVLHGLLAIAMMIPGGEPERTLQKMVDFIEKFSNKSGQPPASS